MKQIQAIGYSNYRHEEIFKKWNAVKSAMEARETSERLHEWKYTLLGFFALLAFPAIVYAGMVADTSSSRGLHACYIFLAAVLACICSLMIRWILQVRHLKKPIEQRRTSAEKALLKDPLARYAWAIVEAAKALDQELERWNVYVAARADGMAAVTRNDEQLYATLVARWDALKAHQSKFYFLSKNKSAKTATVGFPELAMQVIEAEKEFSAVEPAITAGVYREQIQGPVSELEELRKSSGLTGVRVEDAELQAGATRQPDEEADGEEAVVEGRAAANS